MTTLQDKFSLPVRLRRNRRTEAIRTIVRETELNIADLVAPFFVVEGNDQSIPIRSMPGIARLSIDRLIPKVEFLHQRGMQAVALFPTIDPALRTDQGDEAWNSEGLIPRAIQAIKHAMPKLCVITDVALDPYTSHGHDGVLNAQKDVDNDATIGRLAQMAIVHARCGADYIAPSDMMDGRIGILRQALDAEGFEHTGILAYSAKYASSLYGPFREAIDTRLQFGDKKTYHMDPANAKEALLEALLDEQEGADILMIKPALFYLDIIARLRAKTNRPIAAYHVSGEYAMVMAAGQAGYLNADKVLYEALLSIKRAGADLIFTYATEAVLELLA